LSVFYSHITPNPVKPSELEFWITLFSRTGDIMGTIFDLIDQTLDFVLSKIARSVGTREQGPQAPVEYELPKQAVAEAIVNAVAHRDYTSNASVQVMLFSDRLEVWNPGELPPGLTPEKLRLPHPSIPRNLLIAEPLYLTHYIEKAGTGTLDLSGLVAVGLVEKVGTTGKGVHYRLSKGAPKGQKGQ